MDLSYLHYFQKVAELENITKAAERLSITQPALSRVIHNLEDEIGYKLFDRCGKNIVLNPKGEIFLEFTNATLDAFDETKSKIRDLEKKSKARVRLSMRTSLCLLPVLVKEFQKLCPDVELDITRSLNDTEEQDVDVIIDTSLEEGVGENYTTLVQEDSRLLLSRQLLEDFPEHPTLKDFSKETFFVLRGSVQKDITQMACKNAGFTPKISTDFVSSVTIHSFLETGLGVAIVPEKLWNYSKHPGLIMLDLPIVANPKYMVMKCNNLTNQNIQAFKNFCVDFFVKLEADPSRNYFESKILKESQISE